MTNKINKVLPGCFLFLIYHSFLGGVTPAPQKEHYVEEGPDKLSSSENQVTIDNKPKFGEEDNEIHLEEDHLTTKSREAHANHLEETHGNRENKQESKESNEIHSKEDHEAKESKQESKENNEIHSTEDRGSKPDGRIVQVELPEEGDDNVVVPMKHYQKYRFHKDSPCHGIIQYEKSAYLGMLPERESKNKLRRLIKVIDRNKDRILNKTELIKWHMRSEKIFLTDDARTRFCEHDINKDDAITWAELDAQKMIWDDPRLDKMLFKAADRNHNGKLELDEFPGFIHPRHNDYIKPVYVRYFMDFYDWNTDGKVDFDEWVVHSIEGKSPKWIRLRKREFRRELDLDGDGYMDIVEMSRYQLPDPKEVARKEVLRLLAEADMNHDDMLSFDEMIQSHKLFWSSLITAYGQHLHRVHIFQDEV